MMKDVTKQTGSLQPKELEAVYAISRSVAGAISTESALDEILHYLRPVFIFDNIVLYLKNESSALELVYARAVGRGRVREADLAWGEVTAQKTFQSQKIATRTEDSDGTGPYRTNNRYTLGLPLVVSDQILGALVFIRFGGPNFLPGQILLAEFVALHVAQLLQHKQLVEKIASLEARRRLDSLQSDFIATVSHELLTPLGFIKGYATTLLREDTTWDEQTRREFLSIIDEESDRLRELIGELMDSSRLQTGTLPMTFQRLRLDTLLKDLALRTRSRHPQLQMQLSIETPGMQISADPTRLTQVFENIINNAIKYAPGSPLDIFLDQYYGKARIQIRDYGPGIPQDELGKIFQRFYRLPQHSTSVRGTGLGLFICRQIIQTHNGEIEAFSQEGRGSTFSILLPLDHSEDHPGVVGT
jgi:K+-sensing histidine kinase KdpD